MNAKLERIGLGVVVGLIFTGAATALIPSPAVQPTVLNTAIWPESATINPLDNLGNCPKEPCSVRLYAAVLLSDGSVLCSDARPDSVYPPPWDNDEACNEAAKLLDYSLLGQDTTVIARYVRFNWLPQPDSILAAYAQIDYHLMLRKGATYLMDTIAVHPQTSFIWRNGVPDTVYEASVYTRGLTADTMIAGGASPWVAFTYPRADTSIVVVLPVPITLPPVTVDTIQGDTIR